MSVPFVFVLSCRLSRSLDIRCRRFIPLYRDLVNCGLDRVADEESVEEFRTVCIRIGEFYALVGPSQCILCCRRSPKIAKCLIRIEVCLDESISMHKGLQFLAVRILRQYVPRAFRSVI
jgi:hypothetical protein